MMVVLLLATSFWSASLLCLHFRHASIEPSLMAVTTAAAAVSSERVNYSHRSLTEADGNNSSRRRRCRRVFFADTAQPSSCRTRQKKQAETIYRFSCCVCCVSSLGAHTTVIVSPLLLLLFFRSNSSTAKNVVVHWGWGCCRQTVHSVQSNTLQLLLKSEKG